MKAFRLTRLDFANVFLGRQTLEGLEAFGEVIGHQECMQMPFQAIVGLIIVTLHRSLLDCLAHAFDSAIGPGMIDLARPLFDAKKRSEGMAQ